MREILLCALLCILPACGHQFTGQVYRVEGGRQVGEWFSQGTTVWKVAGEFRFERRCQSCHGGIPATSDEWDKYRLHAIKEGLR